MSEIVLPVLHECRQGISVDSSQIGTEHMVRASRSLALLLITGAVVALVDGITRAPNADWESMPFQNPLQYVPYKAAYVFAGLMLPLTLRYARQVGAGHLQGVLLWFVMCTTAYAKDFAYLHIPGIPVFVTDIVLAVLFFFSFLCPRLRIPAAFWPNRVVWLLLILGGVEISRSLIAGREPIMVLRDFAVPLYSIFLLIGLYVVDDWPSIERLCKFFIYGACMSSVTAVGWFAMVPAQRRYIFHAIPHLLAALVGLLPWALSTKTSPRVTYSVLALLAAGIVLANSRTVFVSIGICVVVLFFTARLVNRRIRLAQLTRWSAGVLAISIALLAVLMITDNGAKLVKEASTELISGTVNYQNDANADFRFQAWTEAWNRFSRDPLLGEGFGVPFLFGDENYDSRPHNTYLTVLYKMGLLGLVPLLLLLGHFYGWGWRTLRSCNRQQESLYLYCCMLAFLSMCLSGALNLTLESPFSASVFWLTIGVGYRMMVLLVRQHRKVAYEAIPIPEAVPA